MPRLFAMLCLFGLAIFLGCSGSDSDPTSPGGGTNHNPTVNVNSSTTHLTYGGNATLSVMASDQDGDQLTFAYTATGGTVSASGPTATQATFTAASQWGPATVTVTVNDGNGGSTTATANMYVRNPSPPRICAFPGSPCANGYHLGLRPDENLIVTHIDYYNFSHPSCATSVNYSPGVAVTRNVVHAFDDIACPSCPSATPNEFLLWKVNVAVSRPEPDGGTFTVTTSWDPVSDMTSGCSQ